MSSRRCGRLGTAVPTLIFKPLGAGGEHFIALFGDEDGVFDTDAAEFGIIKAGFDGDDHSGAQFLMIGR